MSGIGTYNNKVVLNIFTDCYGKKVEIGNRVEFPHPFFAKCSSLDRKNPRKANGPS